MPSTASPTHRPVNLAGIRWSVGSFVGGFEAQRPGFGDEVIATGELLSKDGRTPSVWGSKATAAVIAEFPPAFGTVKVVK